MPTRRATRASGGAGLGLAIVAAITEAHGGHAEVQTAPGAGRDVPRVDPPRRRPVPIPSRVDEPLAGAEAPSPKTPDQARYLRCVARPARDRGSQTHHELAEVVALEEADEGLGRGVEPSSTCSRVFSFPSASHAASWAAASA